MPYTCMQGLSDKIDKCKFVVHHMNVGNGVALCNGEGHK